MRSPSSRTAPSLWPAATTGQRRYSKQLIFDPVADSFAPTTHTVANPYFDSAQAVTLESGRNPASGYAHGGVFIIGTDTTGNGKLWTEIYDPISQTFTTPVKILGYDPEIGYTITLLGDSQVSGQVLIQGYTATAQLYDPIAKTFKATTNQPPQPTIPGGQHSPLYLPAAVRLANDKVLVAGGQAGRSLPQLVCLPARSDDEYVCGNWELESGALLSFRSRASER